MVEQLQIIKLLINLVLAVFTVYFTSLAIFSLLKDKQYKSALPQKRFAILIAARNEEMVLPNLIKSLKNQDYPAELFDIIVMPNNCTDNTKELALAAGAKIFECPYPVKSKGEVLHQYFAKALRSKENYDAYCVFDADNIVNVDYLQKVNDALCSGVKIGQGYRESKNPTDTVISGSYSIYYYMIDRFYNRARGVLDVSCLINGSGFVVSSEIIRKFGGWNTKTMTEDIEFSTLCVLAKEKVQWIPAAKFYDEQPLTFEQSWKQRKRWTTGCIQGLETYGLRLLKMAITKRSRSALDFLMFYLTPIIQGLCMILFMVNVMIGMLYWRLDMLEEIQIILCLIYPLAFVSVGVLTSIAVLKLENKDYKKMFKSIFYYWFFILSWIPINVICLVKKQTEWLPIAHTCVVDINDVSSSI